MFTHSAVVVSEADSGFRDLAGAGLAAELPEAPGGRGDPRRPERVAAADQAAPRVDHHRAAVVREPLLDEAAALALVAEAQLLVGDDLGDGEAVMDPRPPTWGAPPPARWSAGQWE